MSANIEVSSALVAPSTHQEWRVNLSCQAAFKNVTAEQDKDKLKNVTKTDAIIHILPYPDVREEANTAFSVLSEIIKCNDCKYACHAAF